MPHRSVATAAKLLARHGYIVSPQPDHPFLAIGPDLLVGGEGHLSAFFAPTPEELHVGTLLILRLAATRLALPRHARCCLLLDAAKSTLLPDNILPHFHAALDVSDRTSLLRFTSSTESADPVQDVPAEIQSHAFRRARFLFELSQRRVEPTMDRLVNGSSGVDLSEAGYDLVSPQRWLRESTFSVRYPQLFQREDVVVAILDRRDRSFGHRFKYVLLAGFGLTYSVDRGIPYRAADVPLKLLHLNKIPGSPSDDPLKPLRAAAFAGWIVTTITTLTELQTELDQLRMRVRPSFR